ncbi:MAG: heavy-metal-associated domain-containing protein [Bacteroidales bacterium]|nr:heavy-metal-associated domain-containing protein [Bacteroidales bacterium]
MKSLFILLPLLLAAPAASAVIPAEAVVTRTAPDKKETKTVTFKTTMHCENCVKKVTENISFMRGVKDLKVSLDENTVTITYDPSRTNEDLLAAAIHKLGYETEKVEPDKA